MQNSINYKTIWRIYSCTCMYVNTSRLNAIESVYSYIWVYVHMYVGYIEVMSVQEVNEDVWWEVWRCMNVRRGVGVRGDIIYGWWAGSVTILPLR